MSAQGNPENPSGKEVRLGRSSLIIYAFNILGAVFSFFFITLVARKLPVGEYGTYVLILRYVSYFLIPSAIFSIWLNRDISRGRNTARTGFISSIIMAAITIPFYIILMLLVSKTMGQSITPLIISTIILLFAYMNSALGPISQGYAPHIIGVSNFIYDAIQATSGYVLVIFLLLGLTGVVIAVIIGYFFTTAFYVAYNYKLLKSSKFEITVLKDWFKASWMPLFGAFCGLIFTLDAFVVSIISGAVPVAYYGVCANILTVTTFATAVANSFYPKVLCKGSLEDLRDAIWFVLLLALPTTIFIFVYATPVAAIFGVKYLGVAWPLRFFALGYFVQLFLLLASLAYQGLESCDKKGLQAKSLFKSALFKGTFVSLIFYLAYISMLAFSASLHIEATMLTSIWGVAFTLTNLAIFIVDVSLIKRDFHQGFELKYLGKKLITFVIPSIPIVLIYFALPVQISSSFYATIINLLPQTILSFGLYFIIVYGMDSKFRTLMRSILDKFLAMLQPITKRGENIGTERP